MFGRLRRNLNPLTSPFACGFLYLLLIVIWTALYWSIAGEFYCPYAQREPEMAAEETRLGLAFRASLQRMMPGGSIDLLDDQRWSKDGVSEATFLPAEDPANLFRMVFLGRLTPRHASTQPAAEALFRCDLRVHRMAPARQSPTHRVIFADVEITSVDPDVSLPTGASKKLKELLGRLIVANDIGK